MKLDFNTFKTIVSSTPLVSIDLILKNSNDQVLLGKRCNRPAKGYWFVPGGRICKDENFQQAFTRLTRAELGVALSLSEAEFLGHYEHHYADNFSNADFSTHYVVLAYLVELDIELDNLPIEQHQTYKWWGETELLTSVNVHDNTKAYFS